MKEGALSSTGFRRAATIWYALLTAILIVLTFLPWATWLGFVRSDEAEAYRELAAGWFVWAAAIVALAVMATVLGRERLAASLDRWVEKAGALSDSGFAWSLSAIAALAMALLSWQLFAHNPHLVDSIAQLFQARIFAAGSLTAPAPEYLEHFDGQHLVQHEGRWFSQYPPGHPALLAIGIWLGAPWLVNVAFAAATLLLTFACARRLLGVSRAKLAALLYLVSPFVLFMGSSYMNHITTGFFLALALYAAIRVVEPETGWSWPVVMGMALGLAATIRPLESAAWAAVLGIWVLARRGLRQAITAGVACLVAVTPLLVYNGLTTGHPLRFGYTVLWGAGHGLGFHIDPWGEPFTPLKSFAVSALDLQRLNVFLFEWPFPSLIFLLAALAIAALERRERRGIGVLSALFLAAPVAYFFYWHRDNYLGPRFLYPSLIPAVLLSAAGVAALDARLGRWRSAHRIVLLLGVLVGLGLNLPRSAGVLAGQKSYMKLHPEVEAERAGIEKALVFVKVGWGNRLIARLWGWGISATETERTYRAVDGCRLQTAVDHADSLAAAGRDSAAVRSKLRRRLEEWREADLPLVVDRWPERTVRFDTTQVLSGPCQAEVARDMNGFTVFGTLLWRNDPWLHDGVIFARSLNPQRNRRLLERYGDREPYLYAPLSADPGAKPVLRPYVIGASSRPPNPGAQPAADHASERDDL